jgi:hypothetical protein
MAGYISVGVITTPDPVAVKFFDKYKNSCLETLSDPKEITGSSIEEIIDIMGEIGIKWPELDIGYLANLSKSAIFQQFRKKLVSSDFYYNRGWSVLADLAKLHLSKEEFAKSLEANKDHLVASFAKNIDSHEGKETNWMHSALELASVGARWPEIAALLDQKKAGFMMLALRRLSIGDLREIRVMQKLIKEYDLDWPEIDDIKKLANDNKRSIIVTMLTTIKKDGNRTDIENISKVISFLRDEGVDWPEFAAIEKSINSQDLREGSKLNRSTQPAG